MDLSVPQNLAHKLMSYQHAAIMNKARQAWPYSKNTFYKMPDIHAQSPVWWSRLTSEPGLSVCLSCLHEKFCKQMVQDALQATCPSCHPIETVNIYLRLTKTSSTIKSTLWQDLKCTVICNKTVKQPCINDDTVSKKTLDFWSQLRQI